MKFQTNIFLIFLLSSLFVNAQKSEFKVPSKIEKKCNYYLEFDYHENDTIVKKLYFYFENAAIDTIYEIDSIQLVRENCSSFDTVNSTSHVEMAKGKICILNSNGKLLNSQGFENVVFTYWHKVIVFGLDPNCMNVVFNGYEYVFGIEEFYEFGKTEYRNVEFGYDLKHLTYLPLLVQKDGKWGLMSIDGIMHVECRYDKIEYEGEMKYKLYKNNILVETVKF